MTYEERNKEIERMSKEGYTQRQIAEKFKISQCRVHEILWKIEHQARLEESELYRKLYEPLRKAYGKKTGKCVARRYYNELRRKGIETVEEFTKLSEEEIWGMCLGNPDKLTLFEKIRKRGNCNGADE